MVIELEGGRLTSDGEWTDVHGERHLMWRAYSSWTKDSESFFTKGAAEFFVWVINERYAGMKYRGVIWGEGNDYGQPI